MSLQVLISEPVWNCLQILSDFRRLPHTVFLPPHREIVEQVKLVSWLRIPASALYAIFSVLFLFLLLLF